MDAVLTKVLREPAFAQKKLKLVSYKTACKIARRISEVSPRDEIKVPDDESVEAVRFEFFPKFLDLWCELQARCYILSVDFPHRHYAYLAVKYPQQFSHVVDIPQPPEEQLEERKQGFSIKDVLQDLLRAYKTCPTSRLPNRALNAIVHLVSTRVAKVHDMQDALEITLDLLLECVPGFARVAEIISLQKSEAALAPKLKMSQTQTLLLPALGQNLQDCITAYCRKEDVQLAEGLSQKQTTLKPLGDTVFLNLKQPYREAPVSLTFEERVSIGNLVFTVAGFVIYKHQHFTTLVRLNCGWVLFNDQVLQPQLIPNLDVFMQHTAKHVLLVMLTDSGMPSSLIGKNLPNLRNTCYIDSILQLLFHCRSFVAHLDGGDKLDKELFPLMTEMEIS